MNNIILAMAILGADPVAKATPENITKWQDMVLETYGRVTAEDIAAYEKHAATKRPVNGPKRKEYDSQLKVLKSKYDAALAVKIEDLANEIRLPAKPAVGDIGRPDVVRVWHVLTPKSAIVEIEYNTGIRGGGPAVTRVVVSGVDTSRWSDDARFEISQVMEVTGVDKSQGQSLLALKPFDAPNWCPKKPEHKSPAK